MLDDKTRSYLNSKRKETRRHYERAFRLFREVHRRGARREDHGEGKNIEDRQRPEMNYDNYKKTRSKIELIFKTAKQIFGMKDLHVYYKRISLGGVTVKFSGIWDLEKRVFHAGETIFGGERESMGFTDLFDRIRRKVRKLIADPAYASRKNVQHLADRSTDPVIRPPKDATPEMKGSPAWSDLVREYKKLGYEDWKSKSGYEKRFENEGMFGAFIERFGDEVRARSERIASKLLDARMVLHNFFAFLVHTA